MKADKIRELDNTELGTQSKDVSEQLFRLRFQMSMGQTDGLKKLRVLKKDRARMLGILREREIHPELAPAPSTKPKAKKAKAEKPAVVKAAKKVSSPKAAASGAKEKK